MDKSDYSDRDPLTSKIIKACYQVHNELGPGFTEKIYLNGLKIVLSVLGLNCEYEKEFTVSLQGKVIGKFRVDIGVEKTVVVEIKAVEGSIPKIFESQVISYLKASGLKVGLLVNFGNRNCEIRRLMI